VNCTQVRDHSVSFAEGELDPSVEAAVREHAASCEECSVLLEDLRSQIASLGSIEREAAPEDAWERLERAMESPRRFSWPWMAAAAVLLICLVLSLPWRTPRPKHFDVVVIDQPSAFAEDEVSAMLSETSQPVSAAVFPATENE
jgi:hypothetical protein